MSKSPGGCAFNNHRRRQQQNEPNKHKTRHTLLRFFLDETPLAPFSPTRVRRLSAEKTRLCSGRPHLHTHTQPCFVAGVSLEEIGKKREETVTSRSEHDTQRVGRGRDVSPFFWWLRIFRSWQHPSCPHHHGWK